MDEATGEIVVPFNTDDVTIIPARRPVDRGLTEYIMRLGRAVHIPPTELIRLSEAGEYTLAKAQKVQRRHYLGAPLIDSRGKAFGVMSVILPGETQAFQPEEVAVISIIAAQVSQAIERKRTEEELKRSEAALNRQNSLFAALIKNIPIGIFMVAAPSGEPLLTNTAALALLGRGILPAANKDNLATVYQAYRAGGSEPYPLNEMPILLGMDGRECRRSVSVSVISRTFLGHVVITAS